MEELASDLSGKITSLIKAKFPLYLEIQVQLSAKMGHLCLNNLYFSSAKAGNFFRSSFKPNFYAQAKPMSRPLVTSRNGFVLNIRQPHVAYCVTFSKNAQMQLLRTSSVLSMSKCCANSRHQHAQLPADRPRGRSHRGRARKRRRRYVSRAL